MSEKQSWAEAREILRKVRAEDGAGAMFILANAIDAAEERGRRSAETERDEIKAALYDLFMAIPPPQTPAWEAAYRGALLLIGKTDRSLIAPRDSAPRPCKHCGSSEPHHHTVLEPRDSGKEG